MLICFNIASKHPTQKISVDLFLLGCGKNQPTCTNQWLLIGDHSVHEEGHAVNRALRSDVSCHSRFSRISNLLRNSSN